MGCNCGKRGIKTTEFEVTYTNGKTERKATLGAARIAASSDPGAKIKEVPKKQ